MLLRLEPGREAKKNNTGRLSSRTCVRGASEEWSFGGKEEMGLLMRRTTLIRVVAEEGGGQKKKEGASHGSFGQGEGLS